MRGMQAAVRSSFCGVAVVLACASCGGSPLLRAAERGDRTAFRAELGSRQKAGNLSNSDAAKVAKAVAQRELAEAKPDAAVQRVKDVRACAYELDDALAERMKTHDEAGAEAALARIESRELSIGDARDYVNDSESSWRAVGARALTREEDRPARQKAMLDGNPSVRRQAMRAAQDAKDAQDLAALAEVVRLDPEPMVKTEAVRAIAALPPQGTDLVNRLRDLWSAADDGLREDIASAYASPDVFAAGGREALRVLVAAEHGPGIIEASAAILRGHIQDRELVQSASAHVLRTIATGPLPHRLQAIAVARLSSPEMLAAVEKASTDDEAGVKLSAHARLLDSPKHRAASIKVLEGIAGQPGPLASRARFILASAGHVAVQAWIESDLAAKEGYDRLAAASALAALGRSARGAPLLADDDPAVRTRAACTLLIAARGK
jgi:hypothetical protein